MTTKKPFGAREKFIVSVLTGGAYLLVASTIAFAEPSTGSHHSKATRGESREEPRARQQDNTGINERDRRDSAITPIEQSNDEKALETTQKIRQGILKKDDLSTYAKNVKIITEENGRVTLRGPVRTAQERGIIESIAFNIAGRNRVHSQLELVPEDVDTGERRPTSHRDRSDSDND